MWITILAGHLQIDYQSGPIFTLHHWVQSRFQEDPDSLNRNLCASRSCEIPAIFLTGITAHHHPQGFVLGTSLRSVSCRTCQSHTMTFSKSQVGKWPPPSARSRPQGSNTAICLGCGSVSAQARTTGQDNLADLLLRYVDTSKHVQVTPTAKCSLGSEHHFHYEEKSHPPLSPRLLPHFTGPPLTEGKVWPRQTQIKLRQ